MMEIPVHPDHIALVDDEDFALVSQHKWYARKRGGLVYAVAYKYEGYRSYKTILMHRLIMGLSIKHQVDHRDSDGLNNRRCNLRTCSHGQNMQNKRAQANNRSGYKGVYFDGARRRTKPWRAKIEANGKTRVLGYFATAEDAAHAYDEAAIRFHGEFARLNFPTQKNLSVSDEPVSTTTRKV